MSKPKKKTEILWRQFDLEDKVIEVNVANSFLASKSWNFDMTKKPIQIQRNPQSIDLHITWMIHNLCNQSCSYCPDNLHDGSIRGVNFEDVLRFIELVNDHYVIKMGFKKIRFSFSGGEPMIFPKFDLICKRIFDLGMSVNVTTNGAQRLEVWEKTASYFDSICMSYHPEYVDDLQFMRNLRYLHDNTNACLPTVRLMMHPEEHYWDRSFQFSQKIKSELINYKIEYVAIQDNYGHNTRPHAYSRLYQTAFLQEHSSEECIRDWTKVRPSRHTYVIDVAYDDGQHEPLEANNLVNRQLVNFLGWSCNIGLEQLMIDVLGHIYKAGCRAGGKVGSIRDLEISLPTSPEICAQSWCHCLSDILTSKKAPIDIRQTPPA